MAKKTKSREVHHSVLGNWLCPNCRKWNIYKLRKCWNCGIWKRKGTRR